MIKTVFNLINIKQIIIKPSMPSIYSNINTNTIEHIFPRSLIIDKKNENDMHNLYKCNKNINEFRSNYKFVDKNDIELNELWEKIDNNNYVNFKEKLFIPNKDSHGIISRAIMYMVYNYNYNYKKVINTENLISWCLNNSPDNEEKYHNKEIYKYQGTNNIFISNYNKKNYIKFIKKLFN